ncbi:hypothetical protein [Bradyrhizobium guangxiense]|uniref:hypothetical protein n=1 Tax=Bradyrhizobium guangxiense TaxID=1325115 RepID=UPI001008CE0C|nr:hypothetical protein [Bradyrhizobium guangxiense]
MSEHDQRQYRRIRDRLAAFESGEITLDKAVIDLEGLLNSLEMTDEPWKEAFRHHWSTLETARALLRSGEVSELSIEANHAVGNATSQLRLLVSAKLVI